MANSYSPLLAKIPSEAAAGSASSVVDRRGSPPLELLGEEIRFGWETKYSDVRSGTFVSLTLGIDAAGNQLAEQMEKMLFRNLEKVTESTGNVIDVGGKLKFEHVYEMFDKREWSLDDNDELEMPDLVVNPADIDKLPKLTPREQQQLNDLKTRKREELLARRRSRRLS